MLASGQQASRCTSHSSYSYKWTIAISMHESLEMQQIKVAAHYNGFIESKRISKDLDLDQLQKKSNKLRLKRTTKMGSPSHTKSLGPNKVIDKEEK
jgi:hypothetical protein